MSEVKFEEILRYQINFAEKILSAEDYNIIKKNKLFLKAFCEALNNTNYDHYDIIEENYVSKLVFLEMKDIYSNNSENDLILKETSELYKKGLKILFAITSDPILFDSKNFDYSFRYIINLKTLDISLGDKTILSNKTTLHYLKFFYLIKIVVKKYEPRHLTEDEITDIISIIQFPKKGNFPLVIEIAENSLKYEKLTQLKKIKIISLQIPLLKEKIKIRFLESLVPNGSTLGMIASEAIVAPISQGAISSFHNVSGSATVGEKLKDIKSVLKSNGKNDLVLIGFSARDFDIDDALKFRSEIEEVYISYFISGDPDMIEFDKEKENYIEFLELFYNNHKNKRNDSKSNERKDSSKTQSQKYKSNEVNFTVKKGMRLYFNKMKMIDRDVTLSLLVSKIFNLKPDDFYLLFSTFDEEKPYIDIYWKIEVKDEQMQLLKEVYPQIVNIKIKGYTDVKNVEIKEFSIISLIKKETKTPDGNFILWFDQEMLQIHNIDTERIQAVLDRVVNKKHYKFNEKTYFNSEQSNLTNQLNFTIQNHVGSFITSVTVDKKCFTDKIESVLEKLKKESFKSMNDMLKIDQDLISKMKSNKSRLNKLRSSEEYKKYIDFFYFKMHAKTKELFEIILHPEINPYSCYYNDAVKTSILFGIGAAELTNIREIIRITDFKNSFINPSNILICSKYMTNAGKITNINYKGATIHEDPPFTLAVTEKALSTLERASIEGVSESLVNYQSSIIFGKEIKMGSKAVELEVDKDLMRKFRVQIQKEDVTVETQEIELITTMVKKQPEYADIDYKNKLFGEIIINSGGKQTPEQKIQSVKDRISFDNILLYVVELNLKSINPINKKVLVINFVNPLKIKLNKPQISLNPVKKMNISNINQKSLFNRITLDRS